ncbi:MAG: glycine--tRNA ligase [bacterium]
MDNQEKFEKVVSLCKRRGFVFPGSEIYGGLANTFDYGPLGVEIINAIKKEWWKRFVMQRNDIYGIDGGILLNPKVWQASGHIENFTDPLVECKKCHKRYRQDFLEQEGKVTCPECGGDLTEPKMFNGMFKTFVGAVEDTTSVAFLRPETAQSIFINFSNIINTFSPKFPFGIAQIGKAFRNEITAGNFVHRTLEFEQMEIEYFIKEAEWEKYFEKWLLDTQKFVLDLGVLKESLRVREHTKKEISHYSKRTLDVEYNYHFGWKELYGLAYRGNYDLSQHSKMSGKELAYKEPNSEESFIPHVIEPSMGVNRLFLVVMLDSYFEDGDRVVLKLKPALAPYKVAVFPLVRNKEELVKKAKDVFDGLKSKFHTVWDDRGNIGKRYYAQDEIGTPYCITVDYQTLEDDTVTIRDRDTAKQERIKISEISPFVLKNID